jgi:hypothetical protein
VRGTTPVIPRNTSGHRRIIRVDTEIDQLRGLARPGSITLVYGGRVKRITKPSWCSIVSLIDSSRSKDEFEIAR